jgi:thiol-disulfide isomerase/thioredoxin
LQKTNLLLAECRYSGYHLAVVDRHVVTEWTLMWTSRLRLGIIALALTGIAVLAVSRPGASPQADRKVDVQRIRYADLAERVKELHGQVIVVDFWADFCLPCKREFPHLIELHQKYGQSGFAAVSVSLDDSHDGEACERVRNFLTNQKATFANFQLDEKPEFWQQKLKIDGPPCVFVFGRRGELLKRYHDGVDYADVEAVVVEALKQK